MTMVISAKALMRLPELAWARSPSSNCALPSVQGVALSPVSAAMRRANSAARLRSSSLISTRLSPCGNSNRVRAVAVLTKAARASRASSPMEKMPVTTRGRSTLRSDCSRMTWPTPMPRSSASVLPMMTVELVSTVSPATMRLPRSAMADTLSASTPVTPTGARDWPRMTKPLPTICGDTALTPAMASMEGRKASAAQRLALPARPLLHQKRIGFGQQQARLAARRLDGDVGNVADRALHQIARQPADQRAHEDEDENPHRHAGNQQARLRLVGSEIAPGDLEAVDHRPTPPPPCRPPRRRWDRE